MRRLVIQSLSSSHSKHNYTFTAICNECAVGISTFRRRWCFYWCARAIKIGRPEKNVGLPCSYLPTQNRPYPKRSLPFWESLFSFFVFSNSVNKLFFKISKSCIVLIEERLHRLLLYAFLPYTASISSCVLGAQKNPLIEMVLLSTQNTCFGTETKKCEKIYLRSFQNESVQLQWQARILTFSKHPPF